MPTGKIIHASANGGVVQTIEGNRYNFFLNQWKHPTIRTPQVALWVEFDLSSSGHNARQVRPLDAASIPSNAAQVLPRISHQPVEQSKPRVPGLPPIGRWLPALALSSRATTSRFYRRADLPVTLAAQARMTKGDVVLVRFEYPIGKLAPDSSILNLREVRQLDQALATVQELSEALQSTPEAAQVTRQTVRADLHNYVFDSTEDVELLEHLLLLADALSTKPVAAKFDVQVHRAVQLLANGQGYYLTTNSMLRALQAHQQQPILWSLLEKVPSSVAQQFLSEMVVELLVGLPETHSQVKAALQLGDRLGEALGKVVREALLSATGYAQYELPLWLNGVDVPTPSTEVLLQALRAALLPPQKGLHSLVVKLQQGVTSSTTLSALISHFRLEEIEASLPCLKPLLNHSTWQTILAEIIKPRVLMAKQVTYWVNGWLAQPAPALLTEALLNDTPLSAADLLTRLELFGSNRADSLETLHRYVRALPLTDLAAFEVVLQYCGHNWELKSVQAAALRRLTPALTPDTFAKWWEMKRLPSPSAQVLWELMSQADSTTRRQLLRLATSELRTECSELWLSHQPLVIDLAPDFLSFFTDLSLDFSPSELPLTERIYAAVGTNVILDWWLRNELITLPWSVIAEQLVIADENALREIIKRAFSTYFAELVEWLSKTEAANFPIDALVALAESVTNTRTRLLPDFSPLNRVNVILQLFRLICSCGLPAARILPWLKTLRTQLPAHSTNSYYYDKNLAAIRAGALDEMHQAVVQHVFPTLTPMDELRWWQAGLVAFPIAPLMVLATYCAEIVLPAQRVGLAHAAGLPPQLIDLWHELGQLTASSFSASLPSITTKIQDFLHRPELLTVLWPSLVVKLTAIQLAALWLAGWPGLAPEGWQHLTVYQRMIAALRHTAPHVHLILPEGLAPTEEEILDWIETCYWEVGEEHDAVQVLTVLRSYSKAVAMCLPDPEAAIDTLVLRCAPAVTSWLWLRNSIDEYRYYDYHTFRRSRNQLSSSDVRELEMRIKAHESDKFARLNPFSEREPPAPKKQSETVTGIVIYKACPANFHLQAPGHLILKLTNTPASFSRPFSFPEAQSDWYEKTCRLTAGHVVMVGMEHNEVVQVSGLLESLSSVTPGKETVRLPFEVEALGGSTSKLNIPPEAAQRTAIGQFIAEQPQSNVAPVYVREPKVERDITDYDYKSRIDAAGSEKRQATIRPRGASPVYASPLTGLYTVIWGNEVVFVWAGLEYSSKATYFFRAPTTYEEQLRERLAEALNNYTRLRSFLIRADKRSHGLMRHLGFAGVLRAGRQPNTASAISNWEKRAQAMLQAGPSQTHPYDPASVWVPSEEDGLLASAQSPTPSNYPDWLARLTTALSQFNKAFLAGYAN